MLRECRQVHGAAELRAPADRNRRTTVVGARVARVVPAAELGPLGVAAMRYANAIFAYLLGAAAVAGATYLAMRTNWPQPWAPLPVVSTILIWRSEQMIAYGYGALLFMIWCAHLALGRTGVPKRSRVLFYVLGALSLIIYAAGWKYGLQYEGVIYSVSVTIINVLIIASLFFLQRRAAADTAFSPGYLFHVLLFVWLVTYWCPYLGELP